jgi:hypothetical protein
MPRDLIRPRNKKALERFMKYIPVHIPYNDSWCLLHRNGNVVKWDLTEEEARGFAAALNVAVFEDTTPMKDLGFNFDEIYLYYPRKIGKKKGIERLKKDINTIDKYNLCIQAVKNYSEYCDKNVSDEKFIKHFSTWVLSWSDWIPENMPSLPIHMEMPGNIQF